MIYVNFITISAARNYQGMKESQGDHMRSPFKQDNVSSSSLEGMERPIRSFKSFIKTVPPHPTPAQKPLPPIPPPRNVARSLKVPTPSPPTIPSPGSSIGNASVISWKAPANWYDDGSPDAESTQPTRPIPAIRTYSLLISDPLAPEEPDMASEPPAWVGSPSSTSRLLPIYERPTSHVELGPPRSPPKSPLPATPSPKEELGEKLVEKLCTPERYSRQSRPVLLGTKRSSGSKIHLRSISPTTSFHFSVTSNGSTKEKAFSSLGIGSSQLPTPVLEDRPYSPEDISLMERTRADRQYLRGKKLQALNKGSPWADDSWEDMEMDDKTRKLSFSQDYHDLLADQYQVMNVCAEEVLRSGGAHQVYEAKLKELRRRPEVPPKGYDLVPPPVSWQKCTGPPTPTGMPQDGVTERLDRRAPSERKHEKITSWVSHRLSVGQIIHASKRQNGQQPDSATARSWEHQIPEAEVDKVLEHDHRFRLFSSLGKPMRFGKKHKPSPASPSTEVPPSAASSPQTRAPLKHRPGGKAVLCHSRSPAPKSDAASVQDASSVSKRATSDFYTHSDNSLTFHSDHRSSFNSQASHSPVAPGIAIRTAFRASYGSASSPRSGQSSPSHPLSHEVLRSPPIPPPPPSIPSSPQSPPLSPNAWKRARSYNGESCAGNEERHHFHHHFRTGFIGKAREARRKHSKELRQDKLKKSIKVLGPTDPGVVARYVKREVVDVTPVELEGVDCQDT